MVVQKEKLFPDFSAYIGEILRAQGVADYDLKRLSEISSQRLANYRAVVLPSGQWKPEQVKKVKAYVERGGSLIAFLPEREVAVGLGVEMFPLTKQRQTAQINGQSVNTSVKEVRIKEVRKKSYFGVHRGF
ncbi:hypothetical protein MYX78_09780 [Acidobacteria bacterium AH-259-G07]|nr:hypothetical protein [Acidobacteria bacterium AH-259-G07]